MLSWLLLSYVHPAYTKEIGPNRAIPRIKSLGNHLRILGELGTLILKGSQLPR
jgi:hypothetical protein